MIVPPSGSRVTKLRREARLSGARWIVKSTLLGKAVAAPWRRRRVPARAWRSLALARRDGTPITLGGGRRAYRAVAVVAAGPGSWGALADALESLRHYEGLDLKLVVVDDATVDCRASVVRTRFPEADVLRIAWPAGDAFRVYRAVEAAFRHVLRSYRFDVLLKCDTDALMIGPGLTELARERFLAEPDIGLLGTAGLGATGEPEDYSFDRWLVGHERRWSRRVRRLAAGAEAAAAPVLRAQGGAYLVSRAALVRAERTGLYPWRQPSWSFLGEDMITSLIVQAVGLRVASFGGPGDPIACSLDRLPLPLQELVSQRRLLVHSVRRGARGESEAEVRTFFRARRSSG